MTRSVGSVSTCKRAYAVKDGMGYTDNALTSLQQRSDYVPMTVFDRFNERCDAILVLKETRVNSGLGGQHATAKGNSGQTGEGKTHL